MKIIFTDLDGTLLDHESYSFKPAEKAINHLKNQNIPLIFCTSKTKAEVEYWRYKIGNTHPFISENGGGIYVPINYFSFPFPYTKEKDGFYLIRLGSSLKELRTVMNKIESEFNVTSFLNMSIIELMKETNLTKTQAKLALQREFDIPFIIHNKKQINNIIRVINQSGLHITKGGRFYHLLGKNDKGKSVKDLIKLFHNKFEMIETIGIGDSKNDFPMLNEVDKPYLVRRKDSSFSSDSFMHVEGVGPVGWQMIVEKEF